MTLTTAPTRPPTRPAPSPAKPTSPAPPTRVAIGRLEARKPSTPRPRMVLYGVEGWGKTTVGAHTPKPVILMARGEQGYDTLLSAGRVPAVPAVLMESWEQTLGWLDAFAADTQGRESIVLDALGGFERLCHEHVCAKNFNNDWSDGGFLSFHKGFEISVGEWMKLLQRLDHLHAKGVMPVLLGHSRVKAFKNPAGADFDRYECDVHAKTWSATARWADAVLFGNYRALVDKVVSTAKSAKGKGIGGTDRVLYAERRDAWDAKNRYGMPAEFDLSSEPSESWAAIWSLISPAT